jgi:hypothetical protein
MTTKANKPEPTPFRKISMAPAKKTSIILTIREKFGCEANFMAHEGLCSHFTFFERLYKSRNAANSKNIMVLYIKIFINQPIDYSTDWLFESVRNDFIIY